MASPAPHAEDASVTEVVFELSDTSYPVLDASEAERCRFDLVTLLPRGGDRYAEFYDVTEADPDRILDRMARHDGVTCNLLARREDGGLFEIVLGDWCPVVHLAQAGAIPREVTGIHGDGRIVSEVLPSADATTVVADFLDVYPSATLTAKRHLDRLTPLLSAEAFQRALRTNLTDRQREVLSAAYEAGYYDRPRRKTGEELAGELDISPSTFAQHVRAAERNLLSILEDSGML